jgi:hypothetical protein
MKIRLILALLFVIGLGTSVYCTGKARVMTPQLAETCCGGFPNVPEPIPLPTPTPTP